MATANKYTMIFKKLKDIFKKDARTSWLSCYGAEYNKKKSLPCVLIFPEFKNRINDASLREYRKTGHPIQISYDFNLWVYCDIKDAEDAYYSEETGSRAGITQIITELEAVIKDNVTGNDLVDTTVQLWTDLKFNQIEIAQRPGKLMIARLPISLISKELES